MSLFLTSDHKDEKKEKRRKKTRRTLACDSK